MNLRCLPPLAERCPRRLRRHYVIIFAYNHHRPGERLQPAAAKLTPLLIAREAEPHARMGLPSHPRTPPRSNPSPPSPPRSMGPKQSSANTPPSSSATWFNRGLRQRRPAKSPPRRHRPEKEKTPSPGPLAESGPRLTAKPCLTHGALRSIDPPSIPDRWYRGTRAALTY